MKKYKVLALDLDGTLLTDDKTVTEKNKKWITRASESGIEVVISTGRGYHNMKHIREELQLTAPMALVNGAEAWDETKTIIKRDLIRQEDLNLLLALRNKYNVEFWAYGINSFFRNPDQTLEVADEKCTQLVMRSENVQLLKEIENEVNKNDHQLEITSSSSINIEFTKKGVSKASALRAICEYLGCTMQDVVAIGDNHNDIQMIKEVGLGISMGNAISELKSISDDITGTNEEDGVAQAIKKHLFMT